jgi:hypothetical protein
MANYSAPRLVAQGAIVDVTLASICVVKTTNTGDATFQVPNRQVGQSFPC